eukprot:CAMPEP_0175052604 /NCGR_PEP_ID=MMETSP0052_2-20121109/8452_1 /TAXON_ID=51329 ORGANISM="Polytomella parva, Strain SAG 63-3" /NCGR_SAMPLE_ID=MMETSP0052_2 /ASSEMBLY_ACC=CAM_ASM_000194 /LENGTH=428 /DNA_ID=CAMNT_0016317027 /DNA_START=69 /DNA_END=1355 /DNA_ORIENTATION=-
MSNNTTSNALAHSRVNAYQDPILSFDMDTIQGVGLQHRSPSIDNRPRSPESLPVRPITRSLSSSLDSSSDLNTFVNSPRSRKSGAAAVGKPTSLSTIGNSSNSNFNDANLSSSGAKNTANNAIARILSSKIDIPSDLGPVAGIDDDDELRELLGSPKPNVKSSSSSSNTNATTGDNVSHANITTTAATTVPATTPAGSSNHKPQANNSGGGTGGGGGGRGGRGFLFSASIFDMSPDDAEQMVDEHLVRGASKEGESGNKKGLTNDRAMNAQGPSNRLVNKDSSKDNSNSSSLGASAMNSMDHTTNTNTSSSTVAPSSLSKQNANTSHAVPPRPTNPTSSTSLSMHNNASFSPVAAPPSPPAAPPPSASGSLFPGHARWKEKESKKEEVVMSVDDEEEEERIEYGEDEYSDDEAEEEEDEEEEEEKEEG